MFNNGKGQQIMMGQSDDKKVSRGKVQLIPN